MDMVNDLENNTSEIYRVGCREFDVLSFKLFFEIFGSQQRFEGVLRIVKIPFDTDHFKIWRIFSNHLKTLYVRSPSLRVEAGYFYIVLVFEGLQCRRAGIAACRCHNKVVLTTCLCKLGENVAKRLQCHIFKRTCRTMVEFRNTAVILNGIQRYRVLGIIKSIVTI